MISKGTLPVLIAEIGGNHEGDFEYAKELVRLAISTPVDYVKLQVYTGDGLVSVVASPERNRHFKKFELSLKQHEQLIQLIISSGKKYLCSVWQEDLVDWVDTYVDIHKVGSGDLTAYPLLRKIASKSKPIILSTGLSNLNEIEETVKLIRNENPDYNKEGMITLLQCTSMYPIDYKDANLAVMNEFRKKFNTKVGFSDHTIGTRALRVAALLGADVLEFHFTDKREGKSFRDHAVSLTAEEVFQLRGDLIADIDLIGSSCKEPVPIEVENNHVVSFRRAVYPIRDIKKGEQLSDENLTILRPNIGIDARFYDSIIGKITTKDLKRHQIINWEDVK